MKNQIRLKDECSFDTSVTECTNSESSKESQTSKIINAGGTVTSCTPEKPHGPSNPMHQSFESQQPPNFNKTSVDESKSSKSNHFRGTAIAVRIKSFENQPFSSVNLCFEGNFERTQSMFTKTEKHGIGGQLTVRYLYRKPDIETENLSHCVLKTAKQH